MAVIQKPNDMLVSVMVNPEANTMDLLQNGINAENTQLLDPQSYKESKLIKEQFSDKDGNFLEENFNRAYLDAAKQYQELAEMNTYKKLELYVEYNSRDLFAPLNSKKKSTDFEVETVKNPLRRSHGVDSLFEWGKQTKSQRELAQMSKIWDSENQVWLDKTAEDRGLLESLFGQSLVYATYDEDTEEIDPITGRKIKHKKGEWKLNDKGQYYTETIGNRSGYGKQFVAASDTLTKEDSFFNKIDFFDSDDIEKSTAGTVMKTVFTIAPYLIPGVNKVWGGVTAAVNMAKVFPTFAKMAEGIVVGGNSDNETAFTRRMNLMENYFSKFNDSYSDEGMKSNWGAEKMLGQISDIFAQLFQMRAAASISKLAVKDPTRKAIKEFNDDFLPKFLRSGMAGAKDIDLNNKQVFEEIMEMALGKMPSVKKALETQSKLSKALSTSYMALVSSADVYSEALAGGYDRRMAGFAGITAALGQFGIMNFESKFDLGGWMLDKSVGYSEGVTRKQMMNVIKKHYDDIAKSIGELAETADKKVKAGIIQKTIGKIIHAFKKARLNLADGAHYLKNGVTEAIEEMTEEAVMDATKGMFDFLSWAGVGNKNASFGVVDDFKSGSFLERYLQNAVGGFMGGILFEFQQKKLEPWIKSAFHGSIEKDKVTPSLVHEIANGHTGDLIKAINEMASLDSDIAALPLELGGQQVVQDSKGGVTRGQLVAKVLTDYVKSLEGVIITEGLNLNDKELVEKACRDYRVKNILESEGLDQLLVSDFTKLASQVAQLKLAVKTAEDREKENNKNKTAEEIKKINAEKETEAKEKIKDFGDRTDWENQDAAFLKELLKQKQEEVKKFLRGEKAEDYLFKTLITADLNIRSAFGALSKHDYTYLKYGKEYKDLKAKDGILNQEQVTKEWEEWRDTSDATLKFLKFGVDAYKRFEKLVGESLIKYANDGYGDVHKIAINGRLNDDGSVKTNGIYSEGNLSIAAYIDDNQGFEHLKLLVNALKQQQRDNKTIGQATLGLIFKQDNTLLLPEIKKIINLNPQLVKILEIFGISKETLENNILENLKLELEQISINELNGSTLKLLINGYLISMLDESLNSKNFNNLNDLGLYLQTNDALIVPLTDFNVESNTKESYLDFLLLNINLNVDNISTGFGTSLLQNYISSEDIIDGEVRKTIAQEAVNNIGRLLFNNINNISDNVLNKATFLDADGKDKNFTFSNNELSELITEIRTKFDQEDFSIDKELEEFVNLKIEEFIQKNNNFENYQDDYSILSIQDVKNGKLNSIVINALKDSFKEDPIYNLYDKVKNKKIKDNPLFDILSKVDMVWSEGGGHTLLGIIKDNHARLNDITKLEDYVAQGEYKTQLESAKSAVDIVRAVLTGMSSMPLGFENPFAVNQQMKRFLDVNKLTSDRKYDTIDISTASLIGFDLERVSLQTSAFLSLSERAFVASGAMEENNRKKYSKLITDFINTKSSQFTIDDFSLLPPLHERDKYKEDLELTMIYYASTIYTKFNEHFKTPKERGRALKTLISQLGIDVKKIDRSSRPLLLNQDLQSLNDLDVINWLVTALSCDAKEFYYRYVEEILKDSENKTVPFFSQELSLYQAYAFGIDKDSISDEDGKLLSVHDFVLNEIFNLKDNTIVALPASRFFFVNGVGGSGKTSTIAAGLKKLFPNKLFRIMAPNVQLIENFKESIEKVCTPEEKAALSSGSIDNFLSKFFETDHLKKIQDNINNITNSESLNKYFELKLTESFFNEFEIKQGSDTWKLAKLDEDKIQSILKNNIDISTLPEILFIDEITQINPLKLLLLQYISKKYNIKIFAFGDDIQRGAKVSLDTQAINDLFMYRSPRLSVSIRSNNKQVSVNNYNNNKSLEYYNKINIENPGSTAQDLFKTYLTENQTMLHYYIDDHTFNGVKFVNSLNDSDTKKYIKLIAECNRRENAEKGVKKIMVITNIDDAGNPVEGNNISAILELCEIKDEEVQYFSPLDVHNKAVQGSESRYVIIDNGAIKDSILNKPGEAFRSLYTFISRASNGALMVFDTEKQINLNIVNPKDRTTQKDEIPQLQEVDKLKAKRLELFNNENSVLFGYTPEKVTLPSLNKEKRGKEEVFVRSETPKKPVTTTTSSVKKSEITETIHGDAELISYDETEQELILDAENVDFDPVGSDDYRVANNPINGSSYTKKGFDNQTEHTSVAAWSAIDHVGLERLKTGGFRRQNTGINFDLDGLFDPNRNKVSDFVQLGFIRFKKILNAALAHEDIEHAKEAIRLGILSDEYVSLFLAEAYSELARSENLSINKDWRTSRFKEVYAEWFSENVDIDPHYYVFAKKLKSKTDLPTTLTASNINYSVGEDNIVLYYGIRLFTKDLSGNPTNLLNQYISLGTLSKKEYFNKKTGKNERIQSQQLQDMYDRADEDLKSHKFIAYELLNSDILKLDLMSTMWIVNNRKLQEDGSQSIEFLSIKDIEQRGFRIDTNLMYLIHSGSVTIRENDKTKHTFQILADLAKLGDISEDISKYWGGEKKLSLIDRIKKLEEKFVTPDGRLKISGYYLATARCVDSSVNKSSAYRRFIFLQPKINSAKFVLEKLLYDPNKKNTNWKAKLEHCRPSSLKRLIAEILNIGGAFDNVTTLLKYLIGTRLYLINSNNTSDSAYLTDKLNLLELIQEVIEIAKIPGGKISKVEFLEMLNKYKFKIILIPFFNQFIYSSGKNTGNALILRLVNSAEYDLENLTLKFNESKTFTDYAIPFTDTDGKKILSDCYGCPILTKSDERTDILDNFGYVEPEGITTLYESKLLQVSNATDPESLGMYNYELQDPSHQIPNSWLDFGDGDSNIITHTEELEQVKKDEDGKDPRFDNSRASYKNVIELPDHYEADKSLYSPKQQKEDFYIIANEKTHKDFFEKHALFVEEKKKIEKYYDKKNHKWVKLKKPKEIKKKKYTGVIGQRYDGNKFFAISQINSMGFEIRPGDYVQLYGSEELSYYVERIDISDKDHPKIVITKVGSPFPTDAETFLFNDVSSDEIKEPALIPIEAVTNVVKRTVINKESINKDYYHNSKNFIAGGKWQNGNYKEVYKSLDTLNEMIEAISNDPYLFIPSLNFNDQFYYIKPIYKEDFYDLSKRSAAMKDPLVPEIEVVTDVVQLRTKIALFNEDESIVGYTLFNLKNDRLSDINHLKKMHDTIFLGNEKNRISSYISHIVFKDPAVLNSVKKLYAPIKVETVDYSPTEIAHSLPLPSEKLVLLPNNRIDLVASSKQPESIIKLSTGVFNTIWNTAGNDIKFPRKYWMWQKIIDNDGDSQYLLYPRVDFYNAEDSIGEGKKTKKVRTAYSKILLDRFNKDCNIGIDSDETFSIWKLRLQGLLFRDYLWEAWEKLEKEYSTDSAETKHNKKISNEKKQRDRSILNKNIDLAKKYIITEVFIKGNSNLPQDIWILYEDGINVEPKFMSLFDFLAQLGTRLEFIDKGILDDAPAIEIGNRISRSEDSEIITENTSSESESLVDATTPKETNLEESTEVDLNKEVETKDITKNFISDQCGIIYPSTQLLLIKIINKIVNNYNDLAGKNADNPNFLKKLTIQTIIDFVNDLNLDSNDVDPLLYLINNLNKRNNKLLLYAFTASKVNNKLDILQKRIDGIRNLNEDAINDVLNKLGIDTTNIILC